MSSTNGDDSPAFVDTNVLVYASCIGDSRKHSLAGALIEELTGRGLLRLSTQVLQEYYVAVTKKRNVPATRVDTLAFLDSLAANPVWQVRYHDIREAILLQRKRQLSFWDALILVCASKTGAKVLYTEDLQHGARLLGLEIRNPFLDA